MGVTRDVKDLKVWQRAVELCEEVYRCTGTFPRDERFGLVAQMRRAAVSVPSNLAEGYGRAGRKDYRQFVCIARGSACELETQFIVAERLGFVDPATLDRVLPDLREVLKMLSGLIRALEE